MAPTIGLVEGVLLLAENLPRERAVGNSLNPNDKMKPKMPLISTSSDENKEVITGAENRQAWMLIGGAIRMAYGLGLDQVSHPVRNSLSHALADMLLTNSWLGRWMAEQSRGIERL